MNYKAIVLSVALVLPIAGWVTTGQSSAAGDGAEIRATGTFKTVFSPAIDERSVVTPVVTTDGVTTGGKTAAILSRYNVSTFAGSLEGTSVTWSTVLRTDNFPSEDALAKKAFQTNIGTFVGTLDRSEPGSFSSITHTVVDRACRFQPVPCQPGQIPAEGKFVVVEGSGMGGLEGICGGGSFKSVLDGGLSTGVTEFDFTFRFGKDCRANN